jgi:WhiB family transcriptional regulator, redox-sensing transcriptional regulator
VGSDMSSGSVIRLTRQAIELTRPVPCRDGDHRLWFAEDPDDLELAKAHCRRCPLRAACLAGAIERREPCGVWGGEIFDRGQILPVKRRRGRPHADRAADRGAGPAGPAGRPRKRSADRITRLLLRTSVIHRLWITRRDRSSTRGYARIPCGKRTLTPP